MNPYETSAWLAKNCELGLRLWTYRLVEIANGLTSSGVYDYFSFVI